MIVIHDKEIEVITSNHLFMIIGIFDHKFSQSLWSKTFPRFNNSYFYGYKTMFFLCMVI